jgi:hypothetical protein
LIALYDRVLALDAGHLLTEHCLEDRYQARCRCGWSATRAKDQETLLHADERQHLLDVVARHVPATDRQQ